MNPIAVWAPFANTLDLVTRNTQIPMTALETGWWQATDITLESGEEYGFIVDGNGPFPDPRSGAQPNGIHGLSCMVDQTQYQWHDRNWRAPPFETAIIYEMHIGTFTEQGTFDAAIQKLDYLCELGITHLEIMPVAEFSGQWGWGYDGVQLYAPHHHYGEPDDLKRLVDACHQKGLAVILDVVYNHLGPTGNYLGQFGPYFTQRYNTPWGDAINFDDAHSDQVRRFFIDNALMWLRDYHFDGLRLDAIHAMHDRTAVHFLRQLADEVHDLQTALRRPLTLIAESDANDPRVIRPSAQGGLGLHSQWSDDFHHALHALFTGERAGYYQDFGTVAHLAKAMQQGYVYDGCYSEFRKRNHGDKPTGVTGGNLLAYTQTHDQVGNRARGDRLSQIVNSSQLKMAAALMLTSPYVPMLFQGEEWAASTPFLYFTNHQEADLANAVKRGRQREFKAFGWQPSQIPDPQAVTTFECSKLQWQEQAQAEQTEMLEWYKALIQLRKNNATLCNGKIEKLRVSFDEQNQWLFMLRDNFAVIWNFSSSEQTLEHAEFFTKNLCLQSDQNITCNGEQIHLPAQSVAILSEVQ